MMAARRRMRTTTPEKPGFDGEARTFDGEAGTVDVWPILAADPADLAAEIERGDHDAYLSLLQHCDKARHDGGRDVVQRAARARKGQP